MRGADVFNEHGGEVPGIARGNRLGRGIEAASLPELGPGGSWSTCMLGCNAQPAPRDVAHVQFSARVAFKLVWVPPAFSTFVLVDDGGALLARGTPAGALPPLRERAMNFRLVQGSKYATAAVRAGGLAPPKWQLERERGQAPEGANEQQQQQ